MSRIPAIAVLLWVVFVLHAVNGYAEPEEVPETVLLNELGEVYEAFSFSHAEHAEMAEEGCNSCHHPPGVYKKCSACHDKGLFEADKLNLLNTKAAFHRQCIECHVEYGVGYTGCTECHGIRP